MRPGCFHVVRLCLALIHHDAEGQEVNPCTANQINIYPGHRVPHVRIHHEEDKLAALEDQKQLHFRDALLVSGVVDESSDHKLRHDAGLEGNPGFASNVAEAHLLFFSERVTIIFSICHVEKLFLIT